MYRFTTNPPSRQVRPRPDLPTIGDRLNAEINRFLDATGMAPATFGRRALNDASFVKRLRGGERAATAETIGKVRAFMAQDRYAAAVAPRGREAARA